jgi:hypothetical protein
MFESLSKFRSDHLPQLVNEYDSNASTVERSLLQIGAYIRKQYDFVKEERLLIKEGCGEDNDKLIKALSVINGKDKLKELIGKIDEVKKVLEIKDQGE